MGGQNRHAGYGENIFTFGAGAVGVSAYALCLVSAFTPAAIGVAGLYSISKTSLNLTKLARRSSRHKDLQKMEKDGQLYRIPEYHPLYDTVNELAGKLDLKTKPSAYALTDQGAVDLAEKQIPWPLGRVLRPLLKDMISKESYKFFATSSIGSFLLVPEEEKRQRNWSDEEQRFTIAHELSHIKTDDSKSVHLLGHNVSKHITRGLFWGSIAVGLAGTVVGGLPAIFASGYGAVSGLATLGLGVAAQKLCFNAASRVQEFRADRNALAVTQDEDAALKVMDKLHDRYETSIAAPSFSFEDIFNSHPSYQRRVSALQKAWDGMRPPLHDNDNTSRISPQARQHPGAAMHRSP